MVCKGGKRAVSSGEDGRGKYKLDEEESTRKRSGRGKRRELIICFAKNSVTIVILRLVAHNTPSYADI